VQELGRIWGSGKGGDRAGDGEVWVSRPVKPGLRGHTCARGVPLGLSVTSKSRPYRRICGVMKMEAASRRWAREAGMEPPQPAAEEPRGRGRSGVGTGTAWGSLSGCPWPFSLRQGLRGRSFRSHRSRSCSLGWLNVAISISQGRELSVCFQLER